MLGAIRVFARMYIDLWVHLGQTLISPALEITPVSASRFNVAANVS